MKLCIMLSIMLLISCAQVPQYVTVYKLPPAPEAGLEPCDNLSLLTKDNVANLIETDMENSSKYQVCKMREQLWINWYNQLKEKN